MGSNVRSYRIQAPDPESPELGIARFFDDLVTLLSDEPFARIGFVATVEYQLSAPWSLEMVGLRRWPGTRLFERGTDLAVWTAGVPSLHETDLRLPLLLTDYNYPDLFGFFRRGSRIFDVGWYCGHEMFGCLVERTSTPRLSQRIAQVLDGWPDFVPDAKSRDRFSGRLWA